MASAPGWFISASSEPVSKAARMLGGFKGRLDKLKPEVGKVFVSSAEAALVGIYGPELGGAPDMWQITWRDGGGSQLGSLRVFTNHPYVIGYEFGTPEHLIEARALRGLPGATNLVFWWEKEGLTFVGPRVNHPGARGHFRLPYLETYLRQVARYGWSDAVKAAINDRPYGYGGDQVPAAPRLFTPGDDEALAQHGYSRPHGR